MKDAIRQTFEALEWHDGIVLSLSVNRMDPGERDEVVVWMEWTDGRQETVRFSECYALSAEMNFGMIGPDSIRAARCVDSSP